MIKFLLILLILSIQNGYAQNIRLLESGKNTSIRGLSVVDDSVAWISGSNGWTSVTTDGGTTWRWAQISGYEKFDFRDIEAFSSTEAVMVSAGSPAVILQTVNSGSTWTEVYRNDSPDIFLDGMDFRNGREGIVYGDPIKGKMQLLRTADSGRSWIDISHNLTISLKEGEASFAASGTGIRILKNGRTFIATGGSQSRIFVSKNFGNSWSAYACPIVQGSASAGPFSLAFINKKTGVAAGGDYLADTSRINNLVITRDGGKTWQTPDIFPSGYKSSVEYLTSDILIATGTSGTDLSRDGGKKWVKLSSEKFNTVRKAKSGSLVLLAGPGGKISILQSK